MLAYVITMHTANYILLLIYPQRLSALGWVSVDFQLLHIKLAAMSVPCILWEMPCLLVWGLTQGQFSHVILSTPYPQCLRPVSFLFASVQLITLFTCYRVP